ncbi:origin recognition complex subunit 6 [Galleria mellonella]|uniref:Origin recognition complex subunit 6 n=1 Tax=Galleria mellonella TaxID=7137 RepID=A0A6J1WC42_GALME|nr:origin recognition complex subunit 6 [Galleria mellonella]
MAAYNRTLNFIASKLGLSEEEKVLNKAAEFERLLQAKTIAGSNITDVSKVAVCLDLAARMIGVDYDVKAVIKYSGLKPAMYANSRKVLENLLEINSDKLSTSLLCITLQCNGVQTLADKILQDYQKQAKMEIDLNLPQYVCMAVYQACRINKVKVPKSKILEKSRLKPAQWAKLDADWTKFVDEHFAGVKKRVRQPKDLKENDDNQEKMEVDSPKKEETADLQIEPYKDWKQRMLEAAYKELSELENKETQSMTPRRSPRKTPQKFSPYKNSSKEKGVRLLFPLNS